MTYENFGLLFLYSFCLGMTITYILWTWIRGTILREDLFVIRDRLWDRAEDFGLFDDPAYQAVRDKLHMLIQGGPYMSVPLLAMVKPDDTPIATRSESDVPEFESVLREAEQQAYERMMAYVSRDRFISYWIWRLWIGGRRFVRQSLERWIDGDGPRTMAAIARYEVRPRRRTFSSAT